MFSTVKPDEPLEDGRPHRRMRDALKQKAHNLFALCDKENKGFASKRDLYRLTDELSLTPEQLDEVFDALDNDENGCLTLEEFTEGLGMFLGIDYSIFQEDAPETSPKASEDDDNEQFEDFLDQLGAQNVFKDEDYIHQMWEKIKKSDPSMLENFENFLHKVTQELYNSKKEFSCLENTLKNQSNIHEEHVQALYMEMEDQLQAEKELLLAQERSKEQKIRDELENELLTKDQELQELIMEHAEMEKQLEELNSLDSETKYENIKLQKERDTLEKSLVSSEKSLNGLQSQLETLRKRSLEERRKRARAALKVSEDIALEREDLVKELHQLKKVNKQLLDEKDELVLSASTTPVNISREGSPVIREESFNDSKILNSRSTSANCETRARKFKGDDITLKMPVVSSESTQTSPDPCQQLKRNPAFNDPLVHPLTMPKSLHNEALISHSIQTLTTPLSIYSDASKSEEECEVDDDYFLENNPQLLGLSSEERILLQNNLNLTPSSKCSNRDVAVDKMNAKSGANFDEAECLSLIDNTHDFSQKHEDMSLKSKTESNSISSHGPLKQKGSPERLFKIVFIGDSGVGKTSFIHRYCRNSFRDTFHATVGVDFQVKTEILNGQVIALQLWDTAGQERFRSITQQYYRKADGIVIVYDVTSENSFKNVRNWITHVKDNTDENIVTMLIGNKIDLCESDDNRVVTSKHGTRLADEFGTLFYETSAKIGSSVHEAMEALSSLLQDKEDEVMERVLHLQEAIKAKKKCC